MSLLIGEFKMAAANELTFVLNCQYDDFKWMTVIALVVWSLVNDFNRAFNYLSCVIF